MKKRMNWILPIMVSIALTALGMTACLAPTDGGTDTGGTNNSSKANISLSSYSASVKVAMPTASNKPASNVATRSLSDASYEATPASWTSATSNTWNMWKPDWTKASTPMITDNGIINKSLGVVNSAPMSIFTNLTSLDASIDQVSTMVADDFTAMSTDYTTIVPLPKGVSLPAILGKIVVDYGDDTNHTPVWSDTQAAFTDGYDITIAWPSNMGGTQHWALYKTSTTQAIMQFVAGTNTAHIVYGIKKTGNDGKVRTYIKGAFFVDYSKQSGSTRYESADWVYEINTDSDFFTYAMGWGSDQDNSYPTGGAPTVQYYSVSGSGKGSEQFCLRNTSWNIAKTTAAINACNFKRFDQTDSTTNTDTTNGYHYDAYFIINKDFTPVGGAASGYNLYPIVSAHDATGILSDLTGLTHTIDYKYQESTANAKMVLPKDYPLGHYFQTDGTTTYPTGGIVDWTVIP